MAGIEALHAPLAAGVGAFALGPALRRQHDVGLGGGLGQEQLLHDQEIKLTRGRT